MRILITGGSGILASEITKLFMEFKNFDVFSFPKSRLDITSNNSIKTNLKNVDPDVIIHTAAITDVALCEKNKKLAWSVNVNGTKKMSNLARKYNDNILFVYISTAGVFDGRRGNYTEYSIPYPPNFYALTKIIGEEAIRHTQKNFIIIRTNFVPKKKWSYDKAFIDRYGTYLFTRDVSYAIKELLNEKKNGTIHITGNKKISMYELAKMTTPNIQKMTLKDYNGPPLPRDMSLNTIRWKKYNIGFSYKNI